MSLTEPTRTERVINAWKGWPIAARVAVPVIMLLVLIGGVLWAMSTASNWWSQRKIDKLKANINAHMSNVVNLEAQKKELELRQAAELEAAKREVNAFHEEANASVAARIEANKALEAVNAARNSNNVNVSVTELEEKLRKLDQ